MYHDVVDNYTTVWYSSFMEWFELADAEGCYVWDTYAFVSGVIDTADDRERADTASRIKEKLIQTAQAARGKFKNVIRRLYEWDLIDGDAFLESKKWPYLWVK